MECELNRQYQNYIHSQQNNHSIWQWVCGRYSFLQILLRVYGMHTQWPFSKRSMPSILLSLEILSRMLTRVLFNSVILLQKGHRIDPYISCILYHRMNWCKNAWCFPWYLCYISFTSVSYLFYQCLGVSSFHHLLCISRVFFVFWFWIPQTLQYIYHVSQSDIISMC